MSELHKGSPVGVPRGTYTPKGPPSQIISREEAQEQGLRRFFTGVPCLHGHLSERYTKNPRTCIDCVKGDPPVPDRAAPGKSLGARKPGPKGASKAAIVPDDRPITMRMTMTQVEQRTLLEAYSEKRNYQDAARVVGLTASQLDVRLAANEEFKNAVYGLERRLNLKRTEAIAQAPVAFEWTEEKRARLIDAYIDTGDMQTARNAITVSNSEYLREIDRNTDFAKRVEEAEPKASKVLEERARTMSLAGNHQLLTLVLRAKYPEYREKVDLNVQGKELGNLSDAELDARINHRLGKLRGTAIDAEFSVVEPQREVKAVGRDGGGDPQGVAEQIPDTFSADGLI